MITSTPLFGQRSPIITPRNAVSRCTPRSRSLESHFGRGLGPWTVQIWDFSKLQAQDITDGAEVMVCLLYNRMLTTNKKMFCF
ncbi:hypothetical protein M7I_3908 [Glarea lozoyensis 74030]|uniref:Uncharacterized protein n=1 Tax=Glarea lozoyensis (strain ATCC 74030 / MF5533) TaxID=1104152 RepID=H0EMR4_GLAL7|nr:hypothetical protein M7I_3908 [Glarea lozoyensis 74030]